MRQIIITLFSLLIFSLCNGQNYKTADSLFYIANARLKTSSQNIDSTDIYESIADYSKAVRLNPKFWQAYRNRSQLYYQTKQYDKAIIDLTLALKYADKTSAINLYDMRAYSYYELGQLKNAITDWTIAVNHLENPSYALLQRAKAKWRLGKKDDACEDYIKAIKQNQYLSGSKEFIECK